MVFLFPNFGFINWIVLTWLSCNLMSLSDARRAIEITFNLEDNVIYKGLVLMGFAYLISPIVLDPLKVNNSEKLEKRVSYSDFLYKGGESSGDGIQFLLFN